MIQLDPSITYGNIIMAVIFLAGTVGGWFAFSSRVETVLKILTERFDKHEVADQQMFSTINTAIIKLVSDTSRVIGRLETEEGIGPRRRREDPHR